jgi:predicted metal-binding transcription factor (methanogenesis marker protein 9)
MTIRQMGIDNREYMRQKHILADKILRHLFYERAKSDSC